MDRVVVAGDGGEGLDVGGADHVGDLSGLTHAQFVEIETLLHARSPGVSGFT
jgi:hypothetical protein